MWKPLMFVVAAMIAGAVGFAVAQSDRTKTTERARTTMPSIEKMTSDAKEMPAQFFEAY